MQIFLSYSSQDRDRVLPLVEALEEDGYTVWWDREIRPGPSFDREIEKAIEEAGCVVVVWSSDAIESEWVRSEVEEGVRRGVLVPVIIDQVLPPLAYRRRQSADLSDWQGERDGEYQKLLDGIQATLAGSAVPEEISQGPVTHGGTTQRRKRRRRISAPIAGLIAALTLVAGVLIGSLLTDSDETRRPQEVTRLEISLPDGETITDNLNNPLMITPDGKAVVYSSINRTMKPRYHVRYLTDLDTVELPIENAGSLWRAPDSEWFLFNEQETGSYKKMRILGGSATSVGRRANETGIRGGTWGTDGTIIVANNGETGLLKINDDGTSETLTELAEGEAGHWHPFLIDGEGIVLYAVSEEGPEPSVYIRLLDLASGEQKRLIDGSQPFLTKSNHLLFSRGNVLWVTAFDRDRLETFGKQIPVLENADQIANQVRGFDVSHNGTLVYLPETLVSGSDLVWLTADGAEEEIALNLSNPATPRLSSDDAQITLINAVVGERPNVWVHTPERDMTTRLSFDDGINVLPVWSPDGKTVAYSNGNPGSAFQIVSRRADGTGKTARLTDGNRSAIVNYTPDGSAILFQTCVETDNCDINQISAVEGSEHETLLNAEFNETSPAVSSSGSFLAYQSDESGTDEIYVRPYPDVDSGRWQISSSGGALPIWSRNDNRLFFVEPSTGTLMAVQYSEENGFSAGRPEAVVDISGFRWRTNQNHRNFDINQTGDRFLMVRSHAGRNRIVVVQNWFEELEQLVPTAR